MEGKATDGRELATATSTLPCATPVQGLDTDEPLLLDATGNVLLRGRHQDTLGSILDMALGPEGGGSSGGGGLPSSAAAQPGGIGPQPAAAGGSQATAQQQQQQQQQQQPQRPAGTRYLCHLEKRLVFLSPDRGGGS